MTNAPQSAEETGCDIAIIGMACRFPRAADLKEFWTRLVEENELISVFSDDQLIAAGVEPELLSHPSYVKAGGLLEGIELFDPAFFGYTPREAELMDPQLRLFLEVAWQVMEDAGYSRDSLRDRVGVYAGAGINTYFLQNLLTNPDLIDSVGPFQTSIFNNRDYLPLQVSYKLNLNGPSLNVQTACSTSLVAVHLACQSLLGRECDLAIAGGVSIRVPQGQGYLFEEGGVLSRDGHTRAFDERASGTVASSGAGAVLLKRLDDAVSDRDFIYAVIKGTAVNNDGALKAGFTAPAIEGQATVIEEAMAMAMTPAESITYVEAHGTGTSLGDPIEIAALTQAFARHTGAKAFCKIGSVKTNLGHLDAAAGVAGLIKTALALQHQRIPASLNFEAPNHRIDFQNGPFIVNTSLCNWDTGNSPRRAGVSSFGIGGTNAHAVLEQAPERHRGSDHFGSVILPISAKSPNALDAAARNLAEYLASHSPVDIADVAYTLQTGRKGMEYRRAVVCADLVQAGEALVWQNTARVFSGYCQDGNRPVAFVFPGQGSQYAGMGARLYETEKVFRNETDRCLSLLDAGTADFLRKALFEPSPSTDELNQTLQRTEFAQPALFIVSYATARQLMHWGVKPDSMIGHSIGEYVAATLSGVMALEDAIGIVAARGRLMSHLPAGAMLAVALTQDETEISIRDFPGISLAAVNAERMTIVSGTPESIERYSERLSAVTVGWKRLRVSHAFHSEMMDPILDRFAGSFSRVKLNPPAIPYISNVTGAWITADEACSPDYYAHHLREAVRFHAGITELMTEPDRVFVEAGPGGLLKQAIGGRSAHSISNPVIETLPRKNEESAESSVLLSALAQLWVNGVSVDWDRLHEGEIRNRVPLPTYPFERQRYWVDSGEGRHQPDQLERKLADLSKWFYRQSWKREPLPNGSKAGETHQPEKPHWLLLADDFGVCENVASICQPEGIDCLIVRQGEGFHNSGDRAYSFDPFSAESYVRLIREIRQGGALPSLIVNCWNESFVSPRYSDPRQARSRLGYNSLIYLSQAIGEIANDRSIEILSVTNQCQDVIGTEKLDPAAALVQGPCKVIPLEYQNLICRMIDLQAPAPGSGAGAVVAARDLFAEARSGSKEQMVAYRHGLRWTACIDPIKIESAPTSGLKVRPGGAYLITGGLGDIEFEIANHLADLGATELIVTGLPKLPYPASWRDLDSVPGSEEIARIAENLNRLSERGINVLADSAESDDYGAMKVVWDEAQQRHGTIDGVIHTALATGGGMIQLKTAESGREVLAPKTDGTNTIYDLLTDQHPDFFVLFSSTLALTGAFGQCDYCAANSYLDAFARSRRSQNGQKVVSINWDVTEWERWQEEAVAASPALLSQIRDVRKRYGISPQEAVRCIDVALGLDCPAVIVSTRDFLRVLRQQAEASDSSLLDQIASIGRPIGVAAGSAEFIAPKGETELAVAASWQDLLGIEQIGANDDFFNIGGNSLVAIQAISRLRREFDVDLPMSALFEHPTVSSLAGAILEMRSEGEDLSEMEAMLAEIETLTPDQVRAALAEEQ